MTTPRNPCIPTPQEIIDRHLAPQGKKIPLWQRLHSFVIGLDLWGAGTFTSWNDTLESIEEYRETISSAGWIVEVTPTERVLDGVPLFAVKVITPPDLLESSRKAQKVALWLQEARMSYPKAPKDLDPRIGN